MEILNLESVQETEFHDRIFQEHFKEKGREAANAALGIIEARSKI